MTTLSEFSFEVNLRTIVREDRSVIFEAWAWVPKNRHVEQASMKLGLDTSVTVDDWVRISAQDRTFVGALNDFYAAAHEYCGQFWEPEPEPAERPKRRIRKRHKPFLG